MASGYVLCRRDPLPIYYSPKVGQKIGAGHNGWSQDVADALGFARAQDARELADVLLPHLAPHCTAVPHDWED